MRLFCSRVVPPPLLLGFLVPFTRSGASHDPHESYRMWITCSSWNIQVLESLQGYAGVDYRILSHRIHSKLRNSSHFNPIDQWRSLGRSGFRWEEQAADDVHSVLPASHCVLCLCFGCYLPNSCARASHLRHPRDALPRMRRLLLFVLVWLLHGFANGTPHGRLSHVPSGLLQRHGLVRARSSYNPPFRSSYNLPHHRVEMEELQLSRWQRKRARDRPGKGK
jgi:hypothetical protein